MPKLIIIAGILPFLISCNTITKLQCDNKDWQSVGLTDGKKGLMPDQAFSAHNDECLQSGTQANEPAYLAGHTEGLTTFCTYDSGFSQANDGFANQPVCPDSISEAFTRGFDAGISEFCTADSGQAFGERPGRYQGTCPAQTEAQFIRSYLSGLGLMATKARRDEADALAKITSLDSSIGTVQAQVRQYDSEISKARKAENHDLKNYLKDLKDPLDAELSSLRIKRNTADRNLSKARSKLDIESEMRLKWQPVLGS